MYRLFRLPMQWTKQQKIVGAVLALAVAAFVVDRWVIGHEDDGPQATASANAPRHASGPTRRPVARPARPAAAVAAAAPEASLGNVAALAERLKCAAAKQKLALDRPVHDAFRPPQAWVGGTPVVTEDQMVVAAREFQARKLTAVIMRPSGRGLAIVNEKTLAIGQSLDGFTLVAVREHSAVFRRGTQRVELRLDEAQQGGFQTSEKTAGIDPSR